MKIWRSFSPATRAASGPALWLVILCGLATGTPAAPGADPKPEPGLLLTLTGDGGKAVEHSVGPEVALHVSAGAPPAPWVGPGKFTAVWEGSLQAELRGQFAFQATLNGTLTLQLNGTNVLEAAGTGAAGSLSPLSRLITLNKGANPIRATYTSPIQGDALVRLAWTEKGTNTSPIPGSSLTHATTPELREDEGRRLGRELFLEFRCIRCHEDPVAAQGLPELKMAGPTLEGIGARRHYGWLAEWIADPAALRPSARMPRLLHGPEAKEEAGAIAAFLASLRAPAPVADAATPVAYSTRQNEPKEGEGTVAAGGDPKSLYERLHCLGCHTPPDAVQPDPAKLSQRRVAEKFPKGSLATFLRAPEAADPWTRMPNFHLSEAEARELEEWLLAAAPKPAWVEAPTDRTQIERGRKRVQALGCVNCHELGKGETEAARSAALSAPKLARLTPDRWTRGCLSTEEPAAGRTVPVYRFTAEQRAALAAFGAADRASLARHVPAEFAERQSRVLNCTACHGQLEGFPPLELLGEKLKPEWSARFIGGSIPHKIRYDAHPKGEVWLEARMPAFGSRAALLAAGLSARHGYGPVTPVEPPADPTLAEIGRTLTGKDGGLSCISCHAVGPLLAMEVFESEGINLTESAARLQPDYFRRWFRAPTSIDPQTKMPVYFREDGTSPLAEILGGDAEKQISAVWEYLKLGEKMPPPATGPQ